jgi:hypothetical protein
LVKSGLPELDFLSRERREFVMADESERPKLLTKIGPASSVYALAKVLLSIRRGADPGKLAQQWEEELGSGHGPTVRVLLDSMLSDDAAGRPPASKVKEEMGAVLRELRQNLANHPDVDRAKRLLGPILG